MLYKDKKDLNLNHRKFKAYKQLLLLKHGEKGVK